MPKQEEGEDRVSAKRVGEAGECECWTEGPNWGAEEREAAFDIYAESSSAHVHCPGSEREDSRRWEKPFYPTDKRRNIAELSSCDSGGNWGVLIESSFYIQNPAALEIWLPVHLSNPSSKEPWRWEGSVTQPGLSTLPHSGLRTRTRAFFASIPGFRPLHTGHSWIVLMAPGLGSCLPSSGFYKNQDSHH